MSFIVVDDVVDVVAVGATMLLSVLPMLYVSLAVTASTMATS